MAQCERMLDTNERCSNQAVPGTPFCAEHRRIVFRRATERARTDTAPLPTPTDTTGSPPASMPTTPASPNARRQNWQASPRAAHQKPTFPGLQVDERGTLVAPQGILWLPAEQSESQFSRLVRLVGFLSQALPLPGQIQVLFQRTGATYMLRLTPEQRDIGSLSTFYDTASNATRFVHGSLYIGQGGRFVQYCDDGAPWGYDVPDFNAPEKDDELLLCASWGTQILSLVQCTEITLHDICLHIVPLQDHVTRTSDTVYALVPSPLYPLLAQYFHTHRQRYRIARLKTPTGELMLFEIAPRSEGKAGQNVPAFLVDYLSRLPRVVLLTAVYQKGERLILLQWKHRYPLHLPHVAGAFPANELLLLMAEHYPTLSLSPAPQFFDGDQLMDVHIPGTKAVQLAPQPAKAPAPLKLEVLLRPDNGPTPPTAALLLTSQELAWLRQLLYLLPAEAFQDYLLYQGQELSVLSSNNRPIEGLPFGQPLRRPGKRALFIPLRSRFLPDLPWPILHEALSIKEQTYTFLTFEYRFDLAETLFVPLSRSLMAEPHRPRVTLHMLAPSSLPVLQWTPPPEPPVEVLPDKEKKRSPIFRRREQTMSRPVEEKTPQKANIEESDLWRAKARASEEAKDFLAAAVCYDFLNDLHNSARCYQLAAEQLSPKES